MKLLFALLLLVSGVAHSGCSDPELQVSNVLLEKLVNSSSDCVENYSCEEFLKVMIANPEGVLNTSGCFILTEGSPFLLKHNCLVRKLKYNFIQTGNIFLVLANPRG